ncbi:MAG: Uma2 family endonuclease [Lewinellaceae bacterium]|nr:Uma2 family endonuclease [Lewinellaceae bacterium]
MKLENLDLNKTYTYADYLTWAFEYSGVKEYWMVFPQERYVLAYVLNEEGKYVGRPPFNKEDEISPVIFPNLVIDLQDIFPERNLVEEPWDDHYVRM